MKWLSLVVVVVVALVVASVEGVTRFPSFSGNDFIPAGFNANAFDNAESTTKKRDYEWPLLSCPQNPQPIPIPIKDLRRVTNTLVEVERELEVLLAKLKMPGVAASVTLGQKVIWAKGFGVANRTSKVAPTPDTIFRIGSISKVFVTLMMLQLRDKGLISLDEEISQKFPQVKLKNPFQTDRGITYRQLAGHLAGLPRTSPCESLWGDCSLTTAQILSRLQDEVFLQPIDDRPAYSNLGFALLGNLLAEIAGMPYNEYLQKNILDPLGMTNTGMVPNPAVLDKFAVGYLVNSLIPAPLYDLGWENPAGGMYSTVNDLAKLASLVFRINMTYGSIPSQILDGQTIKEWLLPDYVTSLENGKMLAGMGIPWESFLDIQDNVASKYWYRGKDGAVLGFTSQLYLVPDLQLGIAVLMNGGLGGPASEFALTISSRLLPVLDAIFTENTQPPPLPPNPQSYLGHYQGVTSNLPFFIDSLDANMTLVKDSQGHPRIYLIYQAYFNNSPLLTQSTYLDWVAEQGMFRLAPEEPTCGSYLGGANQWVPYTNQSFTIPGLWYGITFAKTTA